jgi:two-component system, cell cycle sensor histidine kinase and response regulator CckA
MCSIQRQMRLILPLVQLCSANHSLASSDGSSVLLPGILPIAAFAGMLIGALVAAGLILKATWRTTKQQRTALQASEERYRLVTERSADLIALIDEDGYIRYASPSFASTLGYNPKIVTGRGVFNQVHPDDVAEATTHFARVCRHGAGQAIFRVRHANGTWRWIKVHGARMTDDHTTVVIVGRDITEHKQLEVQFLQLQKLNTIGRIAGGVVHDLNNLLMGIASFAELGRHVLPPEHPVQDDLDEIIKGTIRAATLTRTLLAFGRKQMPAPCVLDLNDLLSNMDRLLRQLIGPNILLQIRLTPDLGQIRADPSQLEQVIVNLVVNARDAMPNGGMLTIMTANVTSDTTSAQDHSGCAGDEYIALTIRDTSIGMDEATRAHLFEPFFTTKGHGQGTGLGLSTCKSIITQHGGTIDVSSEPGNGTNVTIARCIEI